jgi:hypothetical protein
VGGAGGGGDEREEVVGEETTVQGIGAMDEEVSCFQAMSAKAGDVRKVRVGRVGLDVEGERGG